MTTSEMTPADFSAVCGNSNNDGFGGNGAWWLIVLFIFAFCGWGGNNGGGFGGGSGYISDNVSVISSRFTSISTNC